MNNFNNYLKQVNEDMAPFIVDSLSEIFFNYGIKKQNAYDLVNEIVLNIKDTIKNTINKYGGNIYNDDHSLYGNIIEYMREINYE